MYFPAGMFAGQSMTRLMQKADKESQGPEFNNVAEIFVREVVVFQAVVANLAPMRDPDVCHPCK